LFCALDAVLDVVELDDPGEGLAVGACCAGFSSALIWPMPATYACKLDGHTLTRTSAATLQ